MARPVADDAMGVFFLVNLDCGGCAGTIARSLKKIDGVQNVGINYVTDKVYVSYDPAKVTPDQIRVTIEKAGYRALDTERGRSMRRG